VNVFLIVGKLHSHDLISLRGERSDFFGLDGSEIFLAEKLHRKRRVTIYLVLDILSQFGLIKIVHQEPKDKIFLFCLPFK